MKIEVVVASTNEGKVRELLRLFAQPRLALRTLTGLVPAGFEVEESGSTFEENAWLKALEVCRVTGRPALADDSGLEVDALSGRPGVYSARYAGPRSTDADNNELLMRELGGVEPEQRSARFRCVLALAAPGPGGPTRVASAQGAIEGRIVLAPRGSNGFGYDCLFEPLPLLGRTTAEMDPEEKNAISHRAVAARRLAPSLAVWLDGCLAS